MKQIRSPRRPDAARLWADIEDLLAPAFALSPVERVIYFSLLRSTWPHSCNSLWTSNPQLGRKTLLSSATVRMALHRLARAGVLQILDCGRRGLHLRVRTPREVPGCVARASLASQPDWETLDFMARRKFRQAIFRRDRNFCFYCRRRLNSHNRVLDHVVPRGSGGDNSYRNLVTACADCNSAKRNVDAQKFLLHLKRQRIMNNTQYLLRCAALSALQRGRLKPVFRA